MDLDGNSLVECNREDRDWRQFRRDSLCQTAAAAHTVHADATQSVGPPAVTRLTDFCSSRGPVNRHIAHAWGYN